MNSAAAMACQAPFTAAQWEELELQALIFKYLMARIPVPPELLHLLRRRSDLRFYHHAALGYCSYYGKKPDPEPGRCRRTDGKKWRCSKDAHHDSKYCERHMHRSRSRSRKPVELQSKSQQSSLSTMTSFTPSGINGTGSKSITGSFRNTSLQHNVAGGSTLHGSCNGEANGSQLHMNLGSYATGDEDYSYLYGEKTEGDGHSFFSEASGSGKDLGMDSSSLDSSWSLMSSRASSFPASKAKDSSILQATYSQLQSVQDFEQATISSLSRPPPQQQQQYSFFGFEFGSPNPVKLESQSLRPFFDEWPKTKDSWSDLDDGRSNRTSFSTTQLSISIPMASSDFSTTRDTSPNSTTLF